MKFITAAFFSCLVFISCEKDTSNVVDIQYEIACECNFWEDANCNDIDYENAIACYFVTNNIKNYDFEIVEYGLPALCVLCCNCPEGKRLELTVEADDLSTFLDLGFTQ
jgi:hypothetical protein